MPKEAKHKHGAGAAVGGDGEGTGSAKKYRSKPRGGRGRGRGKDKDKGDIGDSKSPGSDKERKLKRDISIEIPDTLPTVGVRMHPYSGRQSASRSLKSPFSVNTITPTGALVLSMAEQCLDSPAFCTRNRTVTTPKGFARETPEEVAHAAKWWADALKNGSCAPDSGKIEKFRESLHRDLEFRCIYHWYPAHPQKGSGYRSIVNGVKMDEALKRACAASGVDAAAVPRARIMFVNPGEVKVQHTGTPDRLESVYRKASSGGSSGSGRQMMEERRAANPFAQAMAEQLAKRKNSR